jgi:integrase
LEKVQRRFKYPFWYIRYAVNAIIKWESVGEVGMMTKTVAQRKLEERRRQIRLGQLDMIEAQIPTLSEFVPEYIAHMRDVKQKRSWKRDKELLEPLCELFGNKKLSNITAKDLEDFRLVRPQEVKPATVNRSLSVLRTMLNLAKRWKKFFGENPVSIVGMPEENNQIERILTREEEKRLIDEAISYLRPVIITALNTEMRRGEILNLTWSDVDLSNNLITVTQTNSKSKKGRRVYINSILRRLLLELKLKSAGSEYVFLDDKANRIRQIRTAFNAACRCAGIHGLRFHDLRHTAATRMIESGASIVAVNKILGHSDIKTTMRYTHPEVSIRDALENLTDNCSQNCSQEDLGKSPSNVTD